MMARCCTAVLEQIDRDLDASGVAPQRFICEAPMQGTRPVPGGTGIETLIGVVTRTYDGAGNFTQVDKVKGSVTGTTGKRIGLR